MNAPSTPKLAGLPALSNLTVGTVQFGLPYGIANRLGQPGPSEVRRILEVAFDGGINCLDTAAVYGESEQVLGAVLRQLPRHHDWTVVTKFQPLEEPVGSREAARHLSQSADRSRQRLGLDVLPLVLFHRERDTAFLEEAMELVGRGWIKAVGVSCSNQPEGAVHYVRVPDISALQVPINLLDPRHRDSGALRQAVDRQMPIFVRSVLLQGLLVMNEADVPPALQSALPVRRRLETIAQQAGMPMAEFAIRYVFGLPGVSSVVVGVESVEQIRQNLEIMHRGPLPTDIQRAAEAVVPNLPACVVTPSDWPAVPQ